MDLELHCNQRKVNLEMSKGSSSDSSGESFNLLESSNQLELTPTVIQRVWPVSEDCSTNPKYDIVYLTNEINKLNGRLEKVENKLYSDIIEQLTKTEGKPPSTRKRNSMPEMMVDTDLITSRPRNQSLDADLRNCVRVLQRNKFATCQCYLMVLVLLGMIAFGFKQMMEVDESRDSQYKPFKVQGRDEYYRNEDLEYKLPKFYYTFHMDVSPTIFYEVYTETFQKPCLDSLDNCFYHYMLNSLNSTNDSVLSAQCSMEWINDGSSIVHESTTDLRIFSIYVDAIGDEEVVTNVTHQTKGLGMLIKMEFENIGSHMKGPLSCHLDLQMNKVNSMLSRFSTFFVHFTVSRKDYESGLLCYEKFIKSNRKVWSSDDFFLTKHFDYAYEETTFDGISDFKAEVSVQVTETQESMLRIHVRPFPTIVHFVSFSHYSYFDWLADMGGLYAIAIGVFLFMATRVARYANRDKAFLSAHGILPALSLPHRNAEELAGLRLIVLAGLGITEKQYFGDEFQAKLSSLQSI